MPEDMDLLAFLQRKNMTQAELSKALDTTPGNVNRWAKREGVPSYELCRKLLLMGMTTKELFGIECNCDENSIKNEDSIDKVLNSPRFMARMEDAVIELRRRGLIK